jgi:hypothetical protein
VIIRSATQLLLLHALFPAAAFFTAKSLQVSAAGKQIMQLAT